MSIDELITNLENLRDKIGGDVLVTVKQEDLDIYYVINNIKEIDAEQSWCWLTQQFSNNMFEDLGVTDNDSEQQPLKIKIIELSSD